MPRAGSGESGWGTSRGAEGLLRVQLPQDRALHIEVNGKHADGLLYSGKAVEGLPEGLELYFPPASAVNPNDARDGAGRKWAKC